MEQPPVFIDHDNPNHVCKLRKAIYGLKQALRAWYHELLQFLVSLGSQNSHADKSLFIFNAHNTQLYLLLYVDDIIIVGYIMNNVQKFIDLFSRNFSLKDLGPLAFFLGVEVSRHYHGIILYQQMYVQDTVAHTNMVSAKFVSTPLATTIMLTLQTGTKFV